MALLCYNLKRLFCIDFLKDKRLFKSSLSKRPFMHAYYYVYILYEYLHYSYIENVNIRYVVTY